MNGFGFRAVKAEGLFHAEYRLAHWSGYRIVRDMTGEPAVFAHAMDATITAANEMVKALNGRPSFWRGRVGTDARDAAERLFDLTRANNAGETEGDLHAEGGTPGGECR